MFSDSSNVSACGSYQVFKGHCSCAFLSVSAKCKTHGIKAQRLQKAWNKKRKSTPLRNADPDQAFFLFVVCKHVKAVALVSF